MRLALLLGGALACIACAATRRAFTEFEVTKPSKVAEELPPPTGIGHTHVPYRGKPAYLASARPLIPTTSTVAGADNPCPVRSRACDERLRALLASLDGQILALSTPPTELQLQAMRLQLLQITPLLTPYPDMAAERDELGVLVEKLPTQTELQQAATRKRMTELTDLLRVQLAAAQ
jgi:hypothetical protein